MCGDVTWNDGRAQNCRDASDDHLTPVTVSSGKACGGCCDLVVDVMELGVAPWCVLEAMEPVEEIVFQQSVNHHLEYHLTHGGQRNPCPDPCYLRIFVSITIHTYIYA